MLFVLLLSIGLLAGVIAGLLGVGGGILFTPVLFYLMDENSVAEPTLFAVASSLLCTWVASMSSSFQQFRQSNFYWKEGLLIGLGGVIGVSFGNVLLLSPYYGEREFRILLGLVLLYSSYQFYKGKRKESSSDSVSAEVTLVSLPQAILTGTLAGILASLAGVGGGIIMVPLLHLVFRQPLFKSVSLSSLAIVVISFTSSLQLALQSPKGNGLTNHHIGYVDFGAALPLLLGALVGGIFGAKIAVVVNKQKLRIVFSIFSASIGIFLLQKVVRAFLFHEAM